MSLSQPMFGKLCRLGLAVVICAGAFLFQSSQAVDANDKLTIGSKAPALDIEHWVSDRNGDFKEVTEFEEGKVYIIEFWATWCGPCIRSMPHLAELQDEYADKGVQLISVSDEKLKVVEKFLKKKVRGDSAKGTYADLTSSYCLTADPDESVYDDYFRAAGRRGIPSAFIVGKTGVIEWIGHPTHPEGEMDEALEKVVGDNWDREEFAAKFKKQQENDLQMAKFGEFTRELWEMKEDGDFEGALEELDAFLEDVDKDSPIYKQAMFIRSSLATEAAMDAGGDEAIAEFNRLAKEGGNPNMINQFAWGIVEQVQGGEKVSPELLEAACNAAKKAVEVSKEADSKEMTSAILDTHANLLFLCDKIDEAIAVQEEAVELSDDPQLTDFLEKLKKAKKKKDV